MSNMDRTCENTMEVDVSFLKTLRGGLKTAELVSVLVAFICFAASSSVGTYLMVPGVETIIALFFFLLYFLKLNKKITMFFWPLIDIFNAVISAIIIFIVCAIAVAGHDNGGTVAGGVFGFIVTILLSVDAFLLFRSVTFNQPASATKTAQEKSVFPKSAN
ncbi:chemokine-like factor isoform X3 [Protopterus annectens]|uniref:chemokine-like factor isoform X2 n=1 Tax=Protopterus annectens TaxID=7888 RepID=UPI001CFACA1B|nr:chemokine-like factor isoform X2 [Protopterus annectens]XP_043937760.1 chemokine-like factor isoform X3 [Protopterus annectens]